MLPTPADCLLLLLSALPLGEPALVAELSHESLTWRREQRVDELLRVERTTVAEGELLVVVDRLIAPAPAFAVLERPGSLLPRGGMVQTDGGAARGFLDPNAPTVWLPAGAELERPRHGQLLVRAGDAVLGLDLRDGPDREPMLLNGEHQMDAAAALLRGGQALVIDGAVLASGGEVLVSTRRWPVDLSAGWRFRPDPMQEGHLAGWNAAWFDDRPWRTIDAGAPWEARGYAQYDGVAWYRRALRLPAEVQRRGGELRFGGIDDNSEVWLDGTSAAVTRGWQSAVRVPIPPGRERVAVAIRVEDTGGNGGLYTRAELHVSD